MERKDMFWDINRSLSYNALFNLIVGNRGGGKSFGAKWKGVKDYQKKGKKFGYVRRYKEELKKSATTFFNDLKKEGYIDSETETKYEGGKFYIDGEVCGYGFSLSTYAKDKSQSYPDIDFIMFDEFILDPLDFYQRYLPTEVSAFLSLCETIIRMRKGVRVYLLANNISTANPYFVDWGLELPNNNKNIITYDDGLILVEKVENELYIQEKKKTPLGKFLMKKQQGKFIIDNESLRDNENFIGSMPENPKHWFNLKTHKFDLGVWRNTEDGTFFVTQKTNVNSKFTINLILNNQQPNELLLSGAKRNILFKTFAKAFKSGQVFYDSVKTKSTLFESMRGLK